MGQTHDEMPQHLAERRCWEVAPRDDSRVARRLDRQELIDGGYRLDEGARLDEFSHFLPVIGVMALLEGAQGAAIHRARLPCVQDCPARWGEDPGGDHGDQCAASLAVQ